MASRWGSRPVGSRHIDWLVRLGMAVTLTAGMVAGDAAAAGADPLCQAATGRVADQYGVGIANATVTVDASPCGSTTHTASTDSQGRYSVLLYPTVTPTATARRNGFLASSHRIAVVPQGGVSNDFTLRYDVAPTAAPSWVRPGDPVTIRATSVATPLSSSGGYVCEWGYSFTADDEFMDPTPVPGVGGTGALSGATGVAAGNSFAAALLHDGTVATWGWNVAGDLGDGTTTDTYQRDPGLVAGPTGGTLGGVTQVSAGSFHVLARRDDGTVVSWGANWNRQLGVAAPDESATPVVVPSFTGTGPLTSVRAVAAGGEQSVALLDDGRLVRWGYVTDGVASRTTAPELVRDVAGSVVSNVVAVDAGDSHVIALRSDGTVLSWGSNAAGQLGNPAVTGTTDAVSVVGFNGTGSLGSVAAVSAGAAHSLVALADGSAAAWGSAQYGQLGDGAASPAPATIPRRVVGESGTGTIGAVTTVQAAGHHSLAVLRTGQVLVWGRNNSGQLATGTTTDTAVPTRAAGGDGSGVLAGVSALSGDWSNSLAVRTGPCDQPRAPVRMWAELGAARVEMTPGTTDAQGTHWSATLTASGADGTRSVRVCALDAAFTGSCSSAESTGPLLSLNPYRATTFGVDGTPPTVASRVPSPLANAAERRPRLAATLTDAGSGVRTSSLALRVDGAPVVGQVNSGTIWWTSTTDLALGVHTAEVSGADIVGNAMAPVSWTFNVVTVSASEAQYRVDPMTKTVMQVGEIPPLTVTFPAVTGTMSDQEVTVSSVVGDGVDHFARIPDLSTAVVVTFSNGVISEQVSAASENNPSNVWHFGALAALAPSANPVVAHVPSSQSAIGDFTVPIPAAYRVPGATATIGSDVITVPQTSTDDGEDGAYFPGELLSQPLRGVYSLSVNATSSVAFDDGETDVALAAGASPSGNPRFDVTLGLPGGGKASTFRSPALGVGDLLPGTKLDEGPDVKCWDGAGYTTFAFWEEGIPCLWSGTWLSQQWAWLSFPNTPIGLYGNHWIARSATTREFLDWHQVSVSVRDFPCPRGNPSGTVAVAIDSFRTESAQVALAPNGQSLWDVLHFDRPQSLMGGDDLSFASPPPNWLRLHTEQGFGPDDIDALYDTSDFNDLTRSSGPVYTAVSWRHPEGEVTSNRDVHMGMATRYKPNTAYATTASRLFSSADTELYALSLNYGC